MEVGAEWRACAFAILLLGVCAAHAPAQTPQPAGQSQSKPDDIGALGFEQLAKIKVTSVSRQDSTVQQTPAAVFVITPEMIRRSGATALPELFRMVPGMVVARIDNNKWAVGARGFNERFGGKLLVQVDGRALYNPIFSGVYWDAVHYPLEEIERIEVIRGPGASSWGANAVNGVINIITKPAKATQGGSISLGGGTEEHGFGDFRYGGAIGPKAHYRLHGTAFDRGEQFSVQGDTNDGWRGASGGLRLDWQPTDRDGFTFQGGYLHSVAGRLDVRPQATAPFFYVSREDDTANTGSVLLRWNRRRSPTSSWALQGYWYRSARHSESGLVSLRWDTYDLDFQQQFHLGKRQKFIYGLGYRLVDARLDGSLPDPGFAVAYPSSPRRPQRFSGFAQDQIDIVDERLRLTLGTKLEHHDSTGWALQPSARILWTPTQRQTVWAAISRAVRTPNFVEDDARVKTVTTPGSSTLLEIRGNAAIEAEEIRSHDLGYRIQATPGLSLDIAAFHNVYNNLVGTRAGAPEARPPLVIVPVNRGNFLKADTYGVEVSSAWQVTKDWRLSTGYTFLRMNLHRALGLPASADAAEGQIPPHQVSQQSNWDLSRSVQLDLTGRYVGGLHGFNPGGAVGVADEVRAYFSLDARLGWSPRARLELSLVGQNLLGANHGEFGTSPSVRSPLVEIRRGVYGKATWRF